MTRCVPSVMVHVDVLGAARLQIGILRKRLELQMFHVERVRLLQENAEESEIALVEWRAMVTQHAKVASVLQWDTCYSTAC